MDNTKQKEKQDKAVTSKFSGFAIMFFTWIVIYIARVFILRTFEGATPTSLFAWAILFGSVFVFSYVRKKLPIKNPGLRVVLALLITEVVAVSLALLLPW